MEADYGCAASGSRKGRFHWPEAEAGTQSVTMRAEELAMLVSGLDLKQAKPRDWYRRPQKHRKERSNIWNILGVSRMIELLPHDTSRSSCAHRDPRTRVQWTSEDPGARR